MYCIYCGKEISENAAFCPSCGSKNEAGPKPFRAADPRPSRAAELAAPASQWKPVFTPGTIDVKGNAAGLIAALTALISLFLPWVRYSGYLYSENYNYFEFLQLLKSDDVYLIGSGEAFRVGLFAIAGVIIIAACRYTDHHFIAFIGDALLLAGARFEVSCLNFIQEEADYFGSIKLKAGFSVMLIAVVIDAAAAAVLLYRRKRLSKIAM